MKEQCQDQHDDFEDLRYELHHMHISALANEVARDSSSHPTPIFLIAPEASHGDEPPPLCSCGLDVCACPAPCENAHIMFRPVAAHSSSPVTVSQGRPCGCSCHDQQIHNEDNLTTTHLVIMSVIRQLQSSTPYGAMPCVVQEQVLQSIDVSEVEYRDTVRWLLDESYIMSPLDDDRLMLVSLSNINDI